MFILDERVNTQSKLLKKILRLSEDIRVSIGELNGEQFNLLLERPENKHGRVYSQSLSIYFSWRDTGETHICVSSGIHSRYSEYVNLLGYYKKII